MENIIGAVNQNKRCKYSSSVTKSATLILKGEVRSFLEEKYPLSSKSMSL